MQTLQNKLHFGRFLRLFLSKFQSNWKLFAFDAGMIGLVCILFLCVNAILDPADAELAYFFLSFVIVFVLLILSTYLASSSIRLLKRRDSACHELMLPATRLEKFGATIVLQGIIIPALLLLIVVIFGQFFYVFSESFRDHIDIFNITSAFQPEKTFIFLILLFFLNQTFFIAGGSFFNKHPMLKLIVFGASLLILVSFVDSMLFGDFSQFDPIDSAAEFIDRALSDPGYNQEFWVVSGFLVGISILFTGLSWRYSSRRVMP